MLPPASEVWCKVIFSEECFKNSVHGGVHGSRGVHGSGVECMVPGVGGGCMVPGGMVPRGASSQRVHGPGGVPGGDPPLGRLLLWAVRILLECIFVLFLLLYRCEDPLT